MKNDKGGIHFIGIGGIGLSYLARYYLGLSKNFKNKAKYPVSGSDAVASDLTRDLIKEGIKVNIGHKKSNVGENVGLVIYNRAIKSDNPELIAAQERGIPVMSYAAALGKVTETYLTIAITGAHGKTTTTALAGLALVRAGIDPTVFVGTKLKEFGGKNIRMGNSPYFVLEADDFGAAFLEYSPAISIVTNVDREHMDFYKTFANVKVTFIKFLSRTRVGGTLILNRDDEPLFSLKSKIDKLAKKNRLKVIWYSQRDPEAKSIRAAIKIPGEHNVSNALAVTKLGALLDIPPHKTLAAFAAYDGAWRRMEYKGKFKDALVYDDYAHHPTEIKATLAAFRQKFPKSPLVCVFQPHQAQRLELLFKEFCGAFDTADVTFILPLYKVLGRDERLPHDSEALVNEIKRRSPNKLIFYVSDQKRLKPMVEEALANLPRALPSPVLIMMGAGDIADYTNLFIKKK